MQPTLRALLTEVLDYAGLFPPAALSLDAAIRNYASDRKTPQAWMLARFVCPAAKLGELAGYRDELFRDGPPFRIAALGGATRNADEFALATRRDARAAAEFADACQGRAFADALETRLPDDLTIADPAGRAEGRIVAAICAAADAWPAAGVFFEAPPGSNWQDGAAAAIRALGPLNLQRRRAGAPPLGFKLRTGGVTADAFPTCERVAWTLIACRDAGVPLKFTAGLHHPIRMERAEVQTRMHGFVNVFVAATLAHAYPVDPLGERELTAVLACEDPHQFEFHADRLEIGQHTAALDVIRQVRSREAISFGSCSFSEPVEDLEALGWW